MNKVLCELLGTSKHVRKSDDKVYYSVRVLIENRVTVMFYYNDELYTELSKYERLSDICLLGELRVKDETSFSFVPQSVEV